MAKLSPVLNWQIIDDEGKPLSGGKIETYLAGSSTPATTFTDSAGSIPQSNPIILNTAGSTSSLIWLNDDLFYKFMVFDAQNNLLATLDNISGISDIQPTFSEWVTLITSFTYINQGTFSVPGDQTESFENKRRIKAQVTAGTVYGTVVKSEFNGTITIVDVALDSGDLDAGLTNIQIGFLTSNETSIPSLIEDFRESIAAHATDTPLWESIAKIQDWTGAPEITDFPTAPRSGAWRLIFPAAGTVFKNNAALNVSGGQDYTTVANDAFLVVSVTPATFNVIGLNSTLVPLSKLDRSGAVGYVPTAKGPGLAPEWKRPVFISSYESPQQPITSAGSLTLSHSLGLKPTDISAALVCKVAEFGFSVNDELPIEVGYMDNARGVNVVPDATSLHIKFGSAGSVFILLNNSTGVSVAATNANWNIIFRARG